MVKLGLELCLCQMNQNLTFNIKKLSYFRDKSFEPIISAINA